MKPLLRARRARGTAVKTGARLHTPLPIGFIASVSIIGLACKPRSGFQLWEIKGVRFPAKAWGRTPAATLRKACLTMNGIPWRKPASDNPSSHGGRLTSYMRGAAGWSRNHLSRRPTASSQVTPSAWQGALHHWRGCHLPTTTAGSGCFEYENASRRNCPAFRANPGFAARPLRPATLPAVKNAVNKVARPLARPRA
jgi:hypothetical protein